MKKFYFSILSFSLFSRCKILGAMGLLLLLALGERRDGFGQTGKTDDVSGKIYSEQRKQLNEKNSSQALNATNQFSKVKSKISPESVEIIELRDAQSCTFRNSDGTYAKKQTTGYFHYKD